MDDIMEDGMDSVQFDRNREFLQSFLENREGSDAADTLRDIASGASKEQTNRLIININSLRRFDATRTQEVISRPMNFIAPFQAAVQQFLKAQGVFNPRMAAMIRDFQVGFEGSFGGQHLSPRGLLSRFLCQMVCVEGIVTKCSLVSPKVVRSVHYCPKTGQHTTREYRDATALDLGMNVGGQMRVPTSSTYPTQDDQGNPLETEFGLSTYKNHQTVTIQEMPERAPLGQLPRSVDIVLDHDLVDKVRPGDRVQCIGVYRALANTANGTTNGVFKTTLLCNNVRVIGRDVGGLNMTADDITKIKEVGEREDVLSLLGRSFSPSIYGHDHIKRALVLQLIGGEEKNLDNGTHLRGDINVLMVGDPSTAKSQLLRSAMGLAPLAVSTTGRGSSGVGLTAAVTNDDETGERRLEAGAMVLADRGLVCIDEFDKMSDQDRVAIHEVMEQQTVTIAKAGIHASLNARCGVLAAANPVNGQYKKEQSPQRNIGLPDSLLSRFDLLFVVLDQMDPAVDRAISGHVLRGHQYRRPGTDMEPEPLNAKADSFLDEEDDEAGNETPMWEKMHTVTYGRNNKQKRGGAAGGLGAEPEEDDSDQVLHKKFLQKYVHYAKSQVTPVLTDDAREYIATEYAQLRAKAGETNRTLPVTARQLETLIRLSTAHAKVRLSDTVDEEDARHAADLLQFAMFHEVGEEAALDEENIDPNQHVPPNVGGGGGTKRSRANDDAAGDDDEMEMGGTKGVAPDRRASGMQAGTGASSASGVSSADLKDEELSAGTERYNAVFKMVTDALNNAEDDGMGKSVMLDEIMPRMQAIDTSTVERILTFMEQDNHIMFQDGTIYEV